MSRGFLSGVAAGAVVSVVGLAGLSLVTDTDLAPVRGPGNVPGVSETPLAPSDTPERADETGAEEAEGAAFSEDQPGGSASETAAGDVSGETTAETPAQATATTSDDASDSNAEGNAPVDPSDAQGDGEPDERPALDPALDPAADPTHDTNTIESGAAPEAPQSPKVNGDRPEIAAAQTPAPDVNTQAPATPDGFQPDTTPVPLPTGPAANVDDTAPEGISPQEDDPAQMTKVETRPKLPQIISPPANDAAIADAADPQTEPPAPKTETAGAEEAPDADANVEADAEPRIKSEPVAPIGDLAENVTTNRLPSIGTAPESEEVDATPAGAEGTGDGVAEASPLAIKRNAVAFTPVADRPLMAVLLKDEGGAREGLGDISSLPFPVTFVVNAIAEDAMDAIAFYRAAGAEVVVEANLPPNSTPTDAEVNFQVQSEVMRAATAVMMSGDSGFQDDAALANQVADILTETGHGVISHPKGLSTGHRLAIKAGVPAGLVFRDVDGAGQDSRAIRRFLDNAAFKARQQDGVIVYGRARPETLQALIEWSLGNRAKSVSVAPVSAVLLDE